MFLILGITMVPIAGNYLGLSKEASPGRLRKCCVTSQFKSADQDRYNSGSGPADLSTGLARDSTDQSEFDFIFHVAARGQAGYLVSNPAITVNVKGKGVAFHLILVSDSLCPHHDWITNSHLGNEVLYGVA